MDFAKYEDVPEVIKAQLKYVGRIGEFARYTTICFCESFEPDGCGGVKMFNVLADTSERAPAEFGGMVLKPCWSHCERMHIGGHVAWSFRTIALEER